MLFKKLLTAGLLRGRRGQSFHARVPFGGRHRFELRLLRGREDERADALDDGKLDGGFRLRSLVERGESRVAPLSGRRDAARKVGERLKSCGRNLRQVARERR